MKIVYVRWIDAAIYPEWTRDHEDASPLEVNTCGFLIYEDKKVLKVALSNSADMVFGGIESIPKSMIIEMRQISK